ncbi:MAG: LPS-assembly protein LptD [bacterium]
MKRRPELLLIAALALLPVLISAGKIEYKAETIIYDNEIKSILLCDSIEINSKDFNLSGDTILISKEEKMLFGKGNITLNMNDFKIVGDSVAFNYDTKKGSIFRAKTKIDKGYLTGERIFAVKDNEYFIYNGHFTTCSSDTPHYSFYASKMHLYQNDRVIVRPFVMFVKNVPVMAVPFFVLPVATTRKSGFLMPKAGYSASDGKYLKDISYFYATNDFSDMTFSVDLYELRGIAGRYELNVLVSPLLSLALNGEYISELTGRKRWSINGSYTHMLPSDISLKSRWDVISDISTVTDYTDTTAVVLKRNAESFLSLSKDFTSYSLIASISRNEDFSDNSVRMKLPSYSGYTRKVNFAKIKNIIPGGINYSHSHSFDNSYYSDSISDTNSIITGLNNRFDTSYKIFKYVNLSPSASLNHSMNTGADISSVNASVSSGLNAQVYGVSLFGFLMYEKFRHTLIPDISFSAGRNWIGEAYSVSFDDSSTDFRKLNFSLTNLFEGKRGEFKDILLRNSFTTGYNMATDSFSSVGANFHFLPDKPVSFILNGSRNPYSEEYRISYTLSASLDLQNPLSEKKLKISLGNTTEKTDSAVTSDRLSGSLGMDIGENLDFTMGILYDMLNREIISTSIVMNRSIHCWRALFRVSTYASAFKYDFSLSLIDIPEVALDKGIFGPLLP